MLNKITIKIIFILCLSFFFSCKTTKNFNLYKSNLSSDIPLPKDEKKLKSIELMKKIENASYVSLKSVVDAVLSSPASLKGEDKLYLYLSTTLLEMLYPYFKNELRAPQYSKKNQYVEGLESIKKKEYPYRLARTDFLLTIIPSLLILKKNFPQTFKEDAKNRIELSKKLNSSSPLPYYLEGLFYDKEYNLTKAGQAYKKAISLEPTFYPAIIKYAKFLNETGEYEEAIKILKTLPNNYQEIEEVQFLTAFSNIGKKDWENANPYIEKLLKDESEEDETLFEKVKLLIEKKEYMKANSLLNIYNTKNKTDKTYLLLKTRIAKEWNKNDKMALQYLSTAYKYYPNDFEILLACANLSLDANTSIQGENIDDFIKKIVNIDIENIKTIKLLLKIELKKENWDNAVNIALNLVKRSSTDENQSLLMKAYLGIGQYYDALKIATLLYEKEKNNSNEVFFDYLEALYKAKSFKVLERIIIENINTSKGERKSMLYYYSAMLKGKASQNYLSSLRQSLLANPRNKKSLFAMYEWYFSNKDYRNAQFYLKQAIGIEDGNNQKYIKLYETLKEKLGL